LQGVEQFELSDGAARINEPADCGLPSEHCGKGVPRRDLQPHGMRSRPETAAQST
jgi:hypothetical protein